MEAVWIALIVAGVGLFGQWLLKRQDFRRQDEVAERLEARLVRAACEVQEQVLVADGKLDEVHKMVDGQRTAMLKYQDILEQRLQQAGVPIPPDEPVVHK